MNGGERPNIDGVRVNLAQPPVQKMATKDTVLLSWESQTFERKELGTKAFLLFAIVLVALIGYSVWQRDWFVIGIIVVVAAVTIWYLKTVKPLAATYSITPLGIYEGERLYPFSEIHSFWLVYNQNVQRLFVAFDRKYLPALSINVNGVDPIALRTVLLRKIPEQTKRTEGIVDKLIRLAGL